jgi:excisionase family DNA binding protein
MVQLLKEPELAELLAIRPATLRKLRYQSRVPFIKIGGAVRYHPTQVAEWLERSSLSCTKTQRPRPQSAFALGH